MIGLIIVSHSKLLADGLHQLAAQMQNKQKCHIIMLLSQHPGCLSLPTSFPT